MCISWHAKRALAFCWQNRPLHVIIHLQQHSEACKSLDRTGELIRFSCVLIIYALTINDIEVLCRAYLNRPSRTAVVFSPLRLCNEHNSHEQCKLDAIIVVNIFNASIFYVRPVKIHLWNNIFIFSLFNGHTSVNAIALYRTVKKETG